MNPQNLNPVHPYKKEHGEQIKEVGKKFQWNYCYLKSYYPSLTKDINSYIMIIKRRNRVNKIKNQMKQALIRIL